MTRYQTAAKKAVCRYLASRPYQAHIPLYTLSQIADRAACDKGKKRELFDSLFTYARVLPGSARTAWIEGFFSVINPFAPQPPLITDREPWPGPFDCSTDVPRYPA